jgi:PAS domain S-box-containing protein
VATGLWTSLRGRLILLALIGFLPLFGLAIYQAIGSRQQALAEARATVARMAKEAESELAAHIQGARQLLHAMAANPALRGSEFAACSAALAAQLKLGQRYATFNVAAPDGRLLCHSDPAAAPANFADRDYFRRALETRQAAIGKPVIGRASNRALLPVAQPLPDASGKVQRVLAAGLDLAWIGVEISSTLSSENLVVVISDEEGRVLYRQPDNDRWFGHLDPDAPISKALRTKRPGETFEAVGLDGATRVFAFAHVRDYPEGSLFIRVGATREALTAAADRELAAALVVLIIIAGLVLFAVIAIAEKFVRGPVAALAGAAGRLGEGNLSERVPEAEFSGELAGLAAAFNRMAAALQTQMTRAAAVVEAAPDPIVIVNRAGRIAIVNARTEAVFGYSRAELLGQPIELLIPRRLHAAHVAQRAPYQEKPQARAMGAGRKLFARRKDGSEFAVDVSLSPLATPEGTLVISTVRDVTERKQAEQAIRDLNASLERRVAERTAQLEAINKELESFSYSVSHDLRSPLRAIDGFSRILGEDYAGKLDDEGRRLLGVIRNNSQKMGQLIDDLLEFSRLGRKSLSVVEINMKRMTEEVFGELQAGDERRHRLALGSLPPAHGDATLVRQAWVNLLDNAIKFSSKREQPVIEVSGHENGAECVYSVKDNGVGFDMRYYDKLFGVFQRLHSAEEFDGTGVGLAIVQRVVARHGGRVWAEGEVNKGAAFYFSLPKGRQDGQI